MNYQRQYEQKIGWKNSPDTSTPLNATNLGKMDNALNYMDEKLSEAVGGGIVEANPSGSATDNLNKIGINGTVYGIPGGGGSYTAGSGISISNSVITNIRKGALTGVIDSVSSNIAHTQITGARDTFVAGALILLQSEAAGTADNLRIQYGAQSSESQTFAIYDTSSTAASVTIASGDTVIMMIDNTGYRAIILNVLSASGGSSYAGLGIGKKTSVSNNVIITDIDLHRAPMVGDRLLVYFDEKVTNPTGLTTYNNGTAVTSNLEPVTPIYINGGWNILEFKNDGFLYNNCWVRMQNVDVPTTLSGLSDTLINSPSDGQMLVYDNNMWKNKTAVQANPTGTAVRELKKIQIGDNVFDTFGLKTFDVSSVTSGVNGSISVDVITASQLNGEIIAVHTGSNTGSTGNAWTLALSDAQTIEALTMSKADGTAFTEVLTANSLMFVKVNTSNDTAVVLGIVGAGTDVEANVGFSDTELKKIKVGDIVYDTDGLRDYAVSNIANNNITVSVLNAEQFVMENIAINTGAHSGSSSAWNLVLDDGTNTKTVALKNADGTAFSDDIHENELLFVYVDTAGNVARVLDIPVNTTEIKTVSGNPITLTDAIAGNAIEVSAEIVASQDLHGYDKPWVGGTGANKWDEQWELGFINTTYGTDESSTTQIRCKGYIPCNPDTNYYFLPSHMAGMWTLFYDDNKNLITSGLPDVTASVNARYCSGVIKTPVNCHYLRFYMTVTYGTTYNDDIAINYPSTVTTYSPYANICPITGHSSVTITDEDAEGQTTTTTVSLGSTIYGGTLDLTSGVLTITHANIASYNGETIGEPWISSLDEYTQGGTPTTGAQVVYTLATPTTTTLTAAQLALVKGYNHLTCNSGEMSITYKASGLDALKERVDELEDAVEDLTADVASKTENSVVGTVENGTTASQPYAVGEHFIRNDKFCTAIAAIASGATLTLNTNYVEGTIADNITKRVNYSATEHVVGTWIDGKLVYEKTIDCGALPSNTTKQVAHGLTNVRFIDMQAMAYNSSSNFYIPIPYLAIADWTYGTGIYIVGANIELSNKSNQTGFSSTYVTVRYIKNS